jgi:hypothetical protein
VYLDGKERERWAAHKKLSKHTDQNELTDLERKQLPSISGTISFYILFLGKNISDQTSVNGATFAPVVPRTEFNVKCS